MWTCRLLGPSREADHTCEMATMVRAKIATTFIILFLLCSSFLMR
jgi:hypothetical protein